jgi:GntR family transcriptional regulator, rspAB operon transcriptional repressor
MSVIDKSKSEVAYDVIKENILKNSLESGAVISENQIAEQLGISRSPVRTAFYKLASEGFLKILPSRGAIVQELSIKEAHDIYDLRTAVESFILRQAFEFITPEDITALRQLIIEQEKAYFSGNPQQSMSVDMQFHAYFGKYYSNNKFEELIRNSRERFSSFGYIALTKPGRIHSTLTEHQAIVNELENRNLQSVIDNLEKHFETAKRFLLLK